MISLYETEFTETESRAETATGGGMREQEVIA